MLVTNQKRESKNRQICGGESSVSDDHSQQIESSRTLALNLAQQLCGWGAEKEMLEETQGEVKKEVLGSGDSKNGFELVQGFQTEDGQQEDLMTLLGVATRHSIGT